MSAIEEKILPQATTPERKRGESVVSKFLRLVCSVRLGVVLLCLLGLACLIGMLIMQQNVDGFENYYAALTPSQRLLYGKLGFFNIYHAWYFNALLCMLSLNIILASIDRFPKTWKFVSKPQVVVPLRWLSDQKHSASPTTQSSAQLVDHWLSNPARPSRVSNAAHVSAPDPPAEPPRRAVAYVPRAG